MRGYDLRHDTESRLHTIQPSGSKSDNIVLTQNNGLPLYSDRAMGGPMGGPVSGPGPKILVEEDRDRSYEEEAQGQELSFYALDINSISDLIQSQNLLQYQNSLITSLRIMHCEQFCNINGIQIQMFQNLSELNLSSNNIEDISELSILKKVKTLNLSCNLITQIRGLENMLRSLEKLILSHNRIISLDFFKKHVQNG